MDLPSRRYQAIHERYMSSHRWDMITYVFDCLLLVWLWTNEYNLGFWLFLSYVFISSCVGASIIKNRNRLLGINDMRQKEVKKC